MTVPALPAVVSLAALIVYQGTAMAVGQARIQHQVKPPASSGPEPFERALRVQQNTLEQLVFFLPSFWLAALLGNQDWASLLGFIWVGGRIAYGVGYRQAASRRGPGFGISFLASAALLVMAIVGVFSQG
ncbi:MAG: MAPEG family protein [Cyanobacteria bacterium M_surface_7_m2_040]|nr:MAPEG family protein [Cyanobacteria bacterium K_Offshore_0m_m2_072]MBM5828435.1 MAPEG family protein [Cyanobacteria bacterium M_surface_7_m2_040]